METTGESRSASGLGVRAYPFGVAEGLKVHPMYRHLQEHEPLCRVRLPYGEEAWLVTRYEDFKTLRDTSLFRAATATDDQPRRTPDVLPMGLMDMDPPQHTRVRDVIGKAFTARQVGQMRPHIKQMADDLVTAMLAAGPPADLVQSLGLPLTLSTIGEVLGIPPDDRSRFEKLVEIPLWTGSPTEYRLSEHIGDIMAFASDLLERRRREPADGLLDALIRANDSEGRLSDDELFILTVTLLGAGYEETKHEINNFVYLLLTHPDQWALLCEHPELISNAVEELLRFTPIAPVTAIPRYAKVDVHMSGGTVRAGEPVLASLIAANRDPRAFPDPDRLDVTRRPITPHVTFGFGTHYCIGAALSRIEIQEALAALVARVPGLRLAVDPDEIVWDVSQVAQGPRALPLTW
jgi:cytochrome P450